tara:strand:- start:2121 stop:2549 length:429 start_codon:yes stop_codon:yes gene_type:complete
MMASIKLDRKSKRVAFNIKGLTKKSKAGLRKALYFSGKLLKKSASDSILKKKFGRAYKYKKRKVRSGKPGEAWANRSGAARRGMSFRVQGADRLYFENSVSYVEYLEDENSLNRPAMWLSIEQNSAKIERYIESELDNAFGI